MFFRFIGENGMADLLELLDKAIDGITSRTSRERDDAGGASVTVNQLIQRVLPVLPVVSAEKRGNCGRTTNPREIAHRDRQDVACERAVLKNTGSVGSTGSSKASCLFAASRKNHSRGKYGKAANALEGLRQARDGLSPGGRGAVVDFDSKIQRVWADGFARLHPYRPPRDVPEGRWMQFIDDIGHFLDQRWAEKAAAFGWGPLDLFGADRERPAARIDHAGLLWLLNGDKLIDLDRHKAVIATKTGTRQTFRRKPVTVGEVVLPWEVP
jgi:hypothetical protein